MMKKLLYIAFGLSVVIAGFFAFHYIAQDAGFVVPNDNASLPPSGLILGNIQNTQLSADVTLRDCETVFAEGIYVTYGCQADINEIFSGETQTTITYHHTLEGNSETFSGAEYNGVRRLISVDEFEPGIWSDPDVAYSFDYSDGLAEIFRDAARDLSGIKNARNVPKCSEVSDPMVQCAE